MPDTVHRKQDHAVRDQGGDTTVRPDPTSDRTIEPRSPIGPPFWPSPVRPDVLAPPLTEPAFGLAPPSAPTIDVDARGYRSARRVGVALRALLLISMMLSALAAAASLRAVLFYAALLDDPLSVSVEEFNAVNDRNNVLSAVQLIGFAVTAVFFIVWTRRAYRNLRPLGAGGLRYTEGWAVGAWFVPILNLIRPKQIVDDIWRASDPDLAITDPPGPVSTWQGKAVSPLLHVWWVLWLGAVLVSTIASTLDFDLGTAAQDNRTASIWMTISALVAIAVCAVAYLVVATTTTRQDERADRMRSGGVPATSVVRKSRTPMWVPLIAGSALSVVAIPVLVLIFDQIDAGRGDDAPVATGDEGTGTLLYDLEAGDCADLPPSFDRSSEEMQETLAVDVKACNTPHELEVVGRATYVGDEADFPGDDDLLLAGLQRCRAPFERYVGASLLDSGLGIFVIQPGEDAWKLGDRQFICMANSFDGEPLEASVAESGGIVGERQRTPFGLTEGDCFDDSDSFGPRLIDRVDCDAPHDNETFAVITHPGNEGDTFPGDRRMEEYATDSCVEEFERVVRPADRRLYAYGPYVWPVDATWQLGHRTVSCVLWSADFGSLEGSVFDR
jgi:hypothetical protein